MFQLLPTITVDASGDLVKPATPMRFGRLWMRLEKQRKKVETSTCKLRSLHL